jgi:parvulin-like peptidyl-prolyl isomerase
MIKKLLLLLFWVGAVLPGIDQCRASYEAGTSPDSVLAKVNQEIVTVGRFYDHLIAKKIKASTPEEDEKAKQEALHELIREVLIDQGAASLDMESDSSFVARRDKYMLTWILDYMYKRDVEDKVEVSDQEVTDHYQKYREEDFSIPGQVDVRELLIRVWADSTQKDYKKKLKKADKEAKNKIRQLHKRIEKGEDFADLCRENSRARTPDRTGRLGFVERGQRSAEFDRTAFSLKIGEISAPFKDDEGYHILQLLDRKDDSYHELDESLADKIREYLKNEKVKVASAVFVDSLIREVQFVHNWEVINSPQPPADQNVWVLTFGQKDTIRYREYGEALSQYMFEVGLDSVGPEHKKLILENFIALPVILQREAEKRGYADLVEYRAEKRSFTLEEAKKKFLSTRVKRDFPPASREELEEYYQAHKLDFPPLGVPVHVYHIVFEDSMKAADVLSQIRQGQDFETMARMYFPGEPEMRNVAYDLGFITRGEMPDEFYQAALSLPVGQVSDPVKTQWGYHLIKVVEKQAGGTTFEDIIPSIQRAIDVQKGQQSIVDWEDTLFDEAELWINERLLKELKLPKPEG